MPVLFWFGAVGDFVVTVGVGEDDWLELELTAKIAPATMSMMPNIRPRYFIGEELRSGYCEVPLS